ncbi:hypothetical protein [Spiroplasma endosymbiont of Clivina fossor]|uniref:hypothetical protein n=1 Tax=Spiroplasma endosymbiont of Clivina fossor TaxID=3066282 RepID=UPI00313CC5D0
MKKLLEILGTITIAGSGILTLVANSPTSAKEQQIKLESSEVNYSQTNNLENLNRNKRQNNNYIKTEVVKVDEWDSKKFLSDLCNNVLKKLLDNDIIKSISDPDNNIRVICETDA